MIKIVTVRDDMTEGESHIRRVLVSDEIHRHDLVVYEGRSNGTRLTMWPLLVDVEQARHKGFRSVIMILK